LAQLTTALFRVGALHEGRWRHCRQ
jgi:hypothetical protein